jgi:hypothetical protein
LGQMLDDIGLFFILGNHTEYLLPLRKQKTKTVKINLPQSTSLPETGAQGHRVVRFTCQSGEEQRPGRWRSTPGAGWTSWLCCERQRSSAGFTPWPLSGGAPDFLWIHGTNGPNGPRSPAFFQLGRKGEH